MTDDMTEGMRDLAQGFIRFSIKAENTEPNHMVHEAFKAFAEAECYNDYTLALKTLLERSQTDYKYEMLYGMLCDLRTDLESLKATQEQPKEESKTRKVF